MSEDVYTNKYEEYEGFKDPCCDKSSLIDGRGVRRTQTLFVDVNVHKDYTPLYTMRDHDHKGCISAYQIYMHSVDEHEAALKLVGSLDHWKKLCSLKWFSEGSEVKGFTGIEQWREDKKASDISFAKRNIIKSIKRHGDVSASRALLAMHKEPAPKKTTLKKEAEKNATEEKQSSRDSKVLSLHAKLNKDNG